MHPNTKRRKVPPRRRAGPGETPQWALDLPLYSMRPWPGTRDGAEFEAWAAGLVEIPGLPSATSRQGEVLIAVAGKRPPWPYLSLDEPTP